MMRKNAPSIFSKVVCEKKRKIFFHRWCVKKRIAKKLGKLSFIKIILGGPNTEQVWYYNG